MLLSETHHSKAATCEDVDEETQNIKPGSRTSANVPRRKSQSFDLTRPPTTDKLSQDGSDSGYSSKTGTNESLSSGHKRSSSLKLQTDLMDRQSQPYAFTPDKPKPPTRPTIKVETTTTKEKSPKKEHRVHHHGKHCYHCGPPSHPYHGESPDWFTHGPQRSPQIPSQPKVMMDKPKARRQSSIVRDRPTSLYVIPTQPHVYSQPTYYEAPPFATNYHGPGPPAPPPPYQHPHPQPPPTPMTFHQPIHYSYETGTPVSAVSAVCPECSGGFDVRHNPPLTPQYGEYPVAAYPVFHEQPQLPPSQHRPVYELERSPAPRPRSATSRSSKTQMDKMNMPPPPKPAPRRQSNDPNHHSARRPSVHYEDEDYQNVSARRASKDLSSTGPPPSAWRKSVYAETAERPKIRKSTTYSDPSHDTSTHTRTTAHTQREALSRRVTDPLEEKTMQAEAYQAKISKGGSAGLTAESLKKLDKQRTSGSDIGTARSKDSARGKRSSTVMSNSGRTNIVVDGGLQVSIPQDMADQEFNLQIGNLTVSYNGDKDAGQLRVKERNRLERAPSNASRGSRRTASGASNVDEQQLSAESSRKSSLPERTKVSPSPSKRSSRASSVSRREL